MSSTEAQTTTDEQRHFTACVFCGSSSGLKPAYLAGARSLAEELVRRDWSLVYGGGNRGLMGRVARTCVRGGLDPKTRVTGIIPRALTDRERIPKDKVPRPVPSAVAAPGTAANPLENDEEDEGEGDELAYGRTVIVEDMHTRKRLMSEYSDCFIVLPGGYGTLEELFEVVTWSQLGIHAKPIVLFDVDGFYGPLLSFLDSAVAAGFIGENQRHIIVAGKTAAEVCDLVMQYTPAEGRLKLNWSDLEK